MYSPAEREKTICQWHLVLVPTLCSALPCSVLLIYYLCLSIWFWKLLGGFCSCCVLPATSWLTGFWFQTSCMLSNYLPADRDLWTGIVCTVMMLFPLGDGSSASRTFFFFLSFVWMLGNGRNSPPSSVGNGLFPWGRCVGVQVLCPRNCRKMCADYSILRRENGISAGAPQRWEPGPEVEGCQGLCWVEQWRRTPLREVAEVHDLSLLRPKGTVCRTVCRTLLEALDVLEV